MPSTDFNTFETTIAPPPPAPPDTPRTFAIVAPAVPVGVTNKTTIYSSVTGLEDDGWDNSFEAYNAAVKLFAQPPAETAVGSIVMVKREAAVLNTWEVDVVSTDDGIHTLEVGGVEAASFTASTSSAEDIKDGLIADYIAGPFNPTQAATSLDTDTLQVEAVSLGAPFVLTATVPSGTAHVVTETLAGGAVRNTFELDINSTDDGAHTISVGGVLAATFTASTSTAEEIKDGLIADYIAGPFNPDQAATTVDTNTLRLEAVIVGVPFLPTAAAPSGAGPTVTQTVANVGIYEDLSSAYDVVNFWGVLTPGLVDDAETAEPLRWCHTDRLVRQNFYFAESNDVGIPDSGDTDNLATLWLAAGYQYVNLLQHTNATEYGQAMAVGRIGGGFPGKRAWHEIALTGSSVVGLRTADETATMRARRVSYTERWYGPTSDLLLLGGYTPSGHFIVQRWVEAWWFYTVRVAVEAKKKSNGGVDLDDAGLAEVVLVVKQAMLPLQNEGIIAEGWTVEHTPLADIPAGELAIGNFQTTGAITATAVITPKLRALRVQLFASAT